MCLMVFNYSFITGKIVKFKETQWNSGTYVIGKKKLFYIFFGVSTLYRTRIYQVTMVYGKYIELDNTGCKPT